MFALFLVTFHVYLSISFANDDLFQRFQQLH